MKKLIVLISLLTSISAMAGEIVKMPMQDLTPTPEMDYVYEIKTTKFDKVLLDCQSLRMGISFSSKGEMVSDLYLNEGMCSEILEFLIESKQNDLPVCLGLDSEFEQLYLSRETDDCV